MSFPQQQRKGIPTSIGTIQIVITDNDGTQANATIVAKAEVLDEDGRSIRMIDHNVGPDLTGAQRTTAWNFAQAIRARAVAEVLPPPA